MKLIISIFIIFQASLLHAQTTNESKFQVNEITLKATSVKDLQDVNWEDIKSVFIKNDPEDVIKISFMLDLQHTKTKLNSSYIISGQTKNLDDLIEKSKKGIKFFEKLATQNTH